ncbi:TolC family protein [Xylophilus sp. GW821-FHT01B05]
MSKPLKTSCSVALALSLLAGCSAFSPPSHPLPVSTGGAQAVAALSPIDDDPWWRTFDSPELDVLVEAALNANQDLRVATARVAQARALVDGANAERLPQIGMSAGGSRGRESSADQKADLAYTGFRASWEVDYLGEKALGRAAAQGDAAAVELAQKAARIAIAAEVATEYFDISISLQREAAAAQALDILERQIVVAQRRFDAGQSTEIDVDRLRGAHAQEQAALRQLAGLRQVKQRQLALLLGANDLPSGVTFAAAASVPVMEAPALISMDLLERRPDVQRQAFAVEAAAARLGMAKRDIYPRIQLDWSGRKERLAAQGTTASPVIAIGYGISLSMPIFDGGRIRSNIAVHEARAQESMAAYEKAMLSALADADVAVKQFLSARESSASLVQAEKAHDRAAGQSLRMFDAGLVDINTLLDTQRLAIKSRDALLQGTGAQWDAAVAVRRAFAGSV